MNKYDELPTLEELGENYEEKPYSEEQRELIDDIMSDIRMYAQDLGIGK